MFTRSQEYNNMTFSQTYEGEFFRDRRHGEGIYTWPDESTYSGTFYMDKKEGYGTFTFSNSNKFEVKIVVVTTLKVNRDR